jgi:hypothetical protein
MDFRLLDYEDKTTWDLICSGKTVGIFQLESNLGKEWSQKVKPRNINELADLISIIRPGCISGDTKITISEINSKERTKRFNRIKISDLYQCFLKTENEFSILSLEERSGKFIKNIVKNVMYTGKKECYRILFTKYPKSFASRNNVGNIWYDLECTDDHKLLTNKGWLELKNISVGDRICVVRRKGGQTKRLETIANSHCPDGKRKPNIDGVKYFQTICYKNYIERCVICGWSECSLDTHHINGNRHTNNSPENLCFLCPNHHRMVENGKITKEELILKREALKLICTEDTEWATFLGKESVGIKDVYDITMDAPNHNFIAGNFVVHNCLEAKEGDKTMTQLYAERKAGTMPIVPLHPCLVGILDDTYHILVYQEQAMLIANKIAGFSLQETDTLRKGIGKKDAALLFSLRESFVQGCIKTSNLSEQDAHYIFDVIQKSARYSFNRSHAVAYAHISYTSAYKKSHDKLKFYRSWLSKTKYRLNAKYELRQLVNDAKGFGVSVKGPNINHIQKSFYIKDKDIYVGISDIKSIGDSQSEGFLKLLKEAVKPIEDMSWFEILIYLLDQCSTTIQNALISSGAIAGSRARMLYELKIWNSLTEREKTWIIGKKGSITFFSLEKAIEALLDSKYVKGARVEKINSQLKLLKHPTHSLEDNQEWIIRTEQELFGVPLSISRIENSTLPDTTCLEAKKIDKGIEIVVGAEILRIKEITIKNGRSAGDSMAFITITDGDEIECIAFAEIWKTYGHILYEGNCIAAVLEKSNKGNGFKINKVYQL